MIYDAFRRSNRMKDSNTSKNIFRIAIVLFIILVIYVGFSNMRRHEETTAGNDAPQLVIFDDGEAPDAARPVDAEPGQTVDAARASDAGQASDVEQAPNDGTTDDAARPVDSNEEQIPYEFRSRKLLDSHYEKHGIEMGFDSAEDYAAAANAVIHNPKSLHKLEQEDGDDVFYLEDTGEFVIVSTDGFIRTYYYASKSYFDRQ